MDGGLVRVGIEDGELVPGEDFEKTLKDLTVEHFERLVAETTYPAKFKITSTKWLTCFKVNERRAERYVHKNRIFLAGDAAHIHSPSGGQGLNTGLHDAHNLAWKLAFAIKGISKPEFILPTYEERAAMADRALRVSSELMARNRRKGMIADIMTWLFFKFGSLILKINSTVFFKASVTMVGSLPSSSPHSFLFYVLS